MSEWEHPARLEPDHQPLVANVSCALSGDSSEGKCNQILQIKKQQLPKAELSPALVLQCVSRDLTSDVFSPDGQEPEEAPDGGFWDGFLALVLPFVEVVSAVPEPQPGPP